MAQLNLALSIGSVNNVDNLRIMVGQRFTVTAVDAPQGEPLEVSATQDAVLKYAENAEGTVVECEAMAAGTSRIYFRHADDRLWAKFTVEVITTEAVKATATSTGKEPRQD